MSTQFLTDTQVLAELGKSFEALRIERGLQDADIMSAGGVTKDALNKFKKGENITTVNLVKILRAADLLDGFVQLMRPSSTELSLFAPKVNKKPKRIVKKATKPIIWGEDL
jgi:hypothetical protein